MSAFAAHGCRDAQRMQSELGIMSLLPDVVQLQDAKSQSILAEMLRSTLDSATHCDVYVFCKIMISTIRLQEGFNKYLSLNMCNCDPDPNCTNVAAGLP